MSEIVPMTRRPGKYLVEARRRTGDGSWSNVQHHMAYARGTHQYPETAAEELEVRSKKDHRVATGVLELRVRCVVPAEGDTKHLPKEAPPPLCKVCERPLGPDRGPEDECHAGCAVRGALGRGVGANRRPSIAELARLARAELMGEPAGK